MPVTELSEDERLARLRLWRSDGVGPAGFAMLLQRFGSAAAALAALPRLARTKPAFARLRVCPADEAEAELAAMAERGWAFLHLAQADYPRLLGAIDDLPAVLGLRGDRAALEQPAVALVGARNASGNGRAFARRMAAELAVAGWTVVSGLARGIDTAAHVGTLEAGGRTVAAVASGLDIVYPEENAPLVERLVERGAVASERPLGAEPKAKHFPKRNRIIAGLSLGVVVIEAAPQSGSLITARLAATYGREVMAVPGSPLDARHRGTNQLLRDGAALVESAADVLAVLEPLRERGPVALDAPRVAAATTRTDRPRPRVVRRVTRDAPPLPAATPPPANGLAARLLERLGAEPIAVDELVRQCAASAAEVLETLFELELDGRIERHPGQRVALALG